MLVTYLLLIPIIIIDILPIIKLDIIIDMSNNPAAGVSEIVSDYGTDKLTLAEIGIYRGDTTMKIAPMVRDLGGKYICVEWFKGNVDSFPNYNPDEHDSNLQAFSNRIKTEHGGSLEKTVMLLDASSIDACSYIDNETIDICFIDADHRYMAVLCDIIQYSFKVKHNGILCGHDLTESGSAGVDTYPRECFHTDCHPKWGHAGVAQAVGEAIGNENVKYYPGTCWATRVKHKDVLGQPTYVHPDDPVASG